MSVFTDKRVFGIKRKNASGLSTAGQVCANDIILWVIFLLPVSIVLHGAGQCFVAIGLFAGNVIGWIFLSKRMNSYVEISKKKIHNAPELFAARYDSWLLKDIVSVIWIVTLGLILVSVLKVIVSVAAYFMNMDEWICMAIIVAFLVFATILIDNRLMGIIKTVVFILVIIACFVMIGLVFYRMDVWEILDNYRRARLSGGTSTYLNILYYDGDTVNAGSAVSMAGVGLGCIAMPLMYKGVINIQNVKELDAGRIWAIVFEGFTIISSCALALLVVPVLYPGRISAYMNSIQVYNLMLKRLLGENEHADIIRLVVLMIFILAVVVMLESFMRTICEHIRGIVPSIKNAGRGLKLAIDITVVVLTGVILLAFGIFVEYDRERMITLSWGMCTAALAAPLMLSLMYRHSTKTGVYVGIISGMASFIVWNFISLIHGETLKAYLDLSGDVAGFAVSFILTVLVSVCTRKNSEEELKDFDRMVEEQR
ncbi:hypothetical protein DWX94_06805 [Coprococcus eutactus]|uniref:Transporter, SSS family n=1 Tax=Coprococcus eutactus TaxID=33043 RepID=A0A3R5WJX6_9FIRM|nr:hypothetical protein DWX94_06805 [Coprococcus eutactus]